MVAISLSSAKTSTSKADALIYGIRNDDDYALFSDQLDAMRFKRKPPHMATFLAPDDYRADVIIAVAVPANPTGEDLRRASARAIRAAKGYDDLAVAMHPEDADQLGAIAEGLAMGAYRFDHYKSADTASSSVDSDSESTNEPDQTSEDPSAAPTTAVILTSLSRQTRARTAVEEATTLCSAIAQARDWVNTPPADLKPIDFADSISALEAPNTSIEIWDEERLRQERCQGLLAVGAGSASPPRLVTISYSPPNASTNLALVGKGITFDSGGLSLKPGSSMMTMKCDMGGAAAVIAATVAIAQLELPIAVTTYACLAENMPSGSALRPGDVLTMRNNRTIEIMNTDAEGRLVLADGLILAQETQPDLIVDVATLTGACVIALGERTAAVLSDHDSVREEITESATQAGESLWPLPITEEMGELVRSSKLADVRQHNPKSAAGTLFAAAFLREFVGDSPWGHLDIAGPAFNDGSAFDYTPAGGTGYGVRTLVQMARRLSQQTA